MELMAHLEKNFPLMLTLDDQDSLQKDNTKPSCFLVFIAPRRSGGLCSGLPTQLCLTLKALSESPI